MILIIFSNCDHKKNLKAELNKSQFIPQGDWISDSDSLSGISVRADKIAFFENMQFNSGNIYNYKIIDSIEFDDETKKTLSTYLVTYNNADTVKYKILNREDSVISLKLNGAESEIFKLKDIDTQK